MSKNLEKIKGICWKCEWIDKDQTSKELDSEDNGLCTKHQIKTQVNVAMRVPRTSGQEEAFYEKTVAKGVKGRDLIQPMLDGKPNQKFLDRYGDGVFKNKPSQLDGEGKRK